MAKREAVRRIKTKDSRNKTFIDVFAGCGGLSLGLMSAGWEGLFAIEKDAFAFETLSINLLRSGPGPKFNWPQWLPKDTHCIASLLETFEGELKSLRGKVDLLAGGPPCQGFSSAGRRDVSDPRNALVRNYLDLVSAVQPKLVLIENVHGITVDFTETSGEKTNYMSLLIEALSKDYSVHWKMIRASDYGVPQNRNRFILMAKRKEKNGVEQHPFDLLDSKRIPFVRSKGLILPVSSETAISDLEVGRNGVVPSQDTPGFNEIDYLKPRTIFQQLMRVGAVGAPKDTRLANHRADISKRFAKIIEMCRSKGRLNTSLDKEMREKFGLKKLALRVLDPDRPSPTITSMPDDLLHYKEARTLTVRENARLQSFPDWFEFRGKYTTGGALRKKEVPRFTQVANAVPPFMAEILGLTLLDWVTSKADVYKNRNIVKVLPVLNKRAA